MKYRSTQEVMVENETREPNKETYIQDGLYDPLYIPSRRNFLNLTNILEEFKNSRKGRGDTTIFVYLEEY